MSVELICLLLSTVVGFVYLMVQATLLNSDNAGGIDLKRDREPVLGVKAQRAGRALRNFLESYPLFIALVLVVELAHRNGMMTSGGAIAYLAGRVVYLPLYIVGIGPARSAAWGLSLLGIVLMFIGILI
ncbi:putative MAPEG superfamily protein [Rhizobium aquaticum]|uniref:MAPEG superfamily protein n=1 Tax=Rhizobium aquaticum TaxID=1549636 RepID=A0ABV2J111_9HYPH